MTTEVPASRPRFMREREILELLPISRATWWRGVKSGRYPEPIKLGPKITAWRSEDIAAFLRRGPLK